MESTHPEALPNYVTRKIIKIYSHYYSLDELDKTNLWAFTWTPDPQRYRSSQPSEQYSMLLQHILLSSHKFFKHFLFVPELNLEGNIHIHGYFQIKDRISFYKTFLPRCKQLGFVKLKREFKQKPIDIGWIDYLCEDTHEMVYILEENQPYPLTDINSSMYKPDTIKLKHTPKGKYSKLYWKDKFNK